jgi:hypothetical protein
MWADSLLAAERAHLMRVALWAVASIVAGSALLAWRAWRGHRSPLLLHFGLQTAAWGAVDLGIVLLGARGLVLRDAAGFTALDRFLWLNVGLDAGYVGVGVTLAACGWALGRRGAPIGAGLGVIVQGLALVVLDGWFVVLLNRMQVA